MKLPVRRSHPKRSAASRRGEAAETVDLQAVRPFQQRALHLRSRLPEVATWAVPFFLILLLGMEKGGFEQSVRGEIGILLWAVVGLGLLTLGLPRSRIPASAWAGLALLAGFCVWTAIGISWSESAGDSVTEVARVVVYVGVLALAMLIGGRNRLRLTLGAVGAACAVVAAIALLSRLHPAWFPDDNLSDLLVGVQNRLRYPVGYWNALAGLVALGVPLVVWGAISARVPWLRGLAAAAVPVMALTIYFTYSRTGVAAALIAIIAFVCLAERRLALLAPLVALTSVSGVVIWQASIREELVEAIGGPTATTQGNEMLAIVIAGCALSAAVVWGLAWGEARGRIPAIPAVKRRTALALTAIVGAIAVIGFFGAGGAGRSADAFEEFKQPAGLSDTDTRLSSVGGNGRWQYWSAAVEASETAPLTGIGPGTYQYWWSENRETSGLIKDAHSLFIETLAELGIVGLALIAAFVALVLVLGAARTIRAVGERRLELAALTASALTFAIAAGVDWLWELAVVPVAFLFVAAAILCADRLPQTEGATGRTGPVDASRGRPRWRAAAARVAGALLAAGAIYVIAIPTVAAERLSQSRQAFEAGDFERALHEAESAESLQPYSGSPAMQRAFVLEATGQYAKAAGAARAATERESTNWETWYLLSRIQAARGGKAGAALIALRRAQELNPFSQLLNPIRCGAEGKLCATPSAG